MPVIDTTQLLTEEHQEHQRNFYFNTTPATREPVRQRLNADIERFLAEQGRITEVAPGHGCRRGIDLLRAHQH